MGVKIIYPPGADSGFVDQDVRSGASPTFDGANFTGIPDSGVDIQTIGSPTGSTQRYLNTTALSAGVIDSTAAITDAGGATIDLAARDVFIHATDSHTGTLYLAAVAASTGVAIPTDTTRWIGIEYNAGSPQWVVKTTDTWDDHTDFAMGSVVNESDTLHVVNNPVRSANFAAHATHRLYETERFQRAERLGGGILGEKGTREVTVSAAEFYDRLNEFPYTAKDTSVADTFDSYSSGGLESTGDTQWPNTEYDNAGTLTAMTASKYANLWFYAEMDDALVMIYGTAEYTTPATALEEGAPSVIPERIAAHGRLLGRIIFQKSAATAVDIESAFETTFSGTGAVNHNDNANIQGGTAGERYHLTVAERTVARTKDFGMVVVQSDTAVTVADGVDGIPIPATMNGMNLVAALATVDDKGVTGTTDIQLRRRRAGSEVDMLSTKITIGDEFFAADGVINTSNDDLATGDIIYIDRDAIHSGTAPNGLSIVLSARLP